MAGRAADMQSSFLLSGLETRYPVQVSARVVASLRQDNLVWSALEDEELYQRAMEAERGNPLFWSPANLGLILLGGDMKAEVLSSPQMPGVDSGLRQQAVRTYEEVIRRGTPPTHLREATLIALALRERRKATGNWNGLTNELLFNGTQGKQVNSRMWKTALAIVWGLIPDANDLLGVLLKTREIKTAAEWVLHCILTTPFDEVERSRRFANLLREVPAGRQIEVLKSLRIRETSDLAARTTTLLLNGHPLFTNFKMKADLDQASAENLAGRVLTLQQLAAFNQLAGSPAQSEACLRIAKSVMEYWQAGLELQILNVKAETTGGGVEEDAFENFMAKMPHSRRLVEEFAPIMLSRPTGISVVSKMAYIPDHPMVLLGKALLCNQEGDCGIAKELGIRASTIFLDYLRENDRPFVGDFVTHWNPLDFINGLLELGLVVEAEVCCEAALENQPTDPVLLTLHADLLTKRGKFRKAKSEMHLAVTLVPHSVELRRKLAETDERSGDWDEAYLNRKNILDFCEGEAVEDKLSFAQAALRSGRIDQVITTCNQILDVDADQAGAHGWLGMALENQQLHESAATHLSKAALLDPEQAEWWLALAALYRNSGDRRSAYDSLRAAVMAAPEAGAVYFGLGEMLLEDGLSSEALPYLKRAGELLPGDEKIGLRLSKALHHLGHLTEARFVVERMRGKWSQQPELAFEFASLACEQGDAEGAIPALEVAVRSEQPKPEWLVKYASVLLDDHLTKSFEPTRSGMRFTQAESMLQKALLVNPTDVDARIMMADALRKQGAFDKALDLYQALAEDPATIQPEQLWKVQHGLGLTALELNLVEPALASIRDAAVHQPGDLALQHDLVRAYLAASLPREAAEVAENALDLAVDDIGNLDWFAEAMLKVGRPERAEEALRAAVDLTSGDPDLLLRLSQVQLQNGNLKEAQATLKTLISDENVAVETLRQAAYIYLRMEDLPAALNCLERATHSLQHPGADLLFDLARLYDQSGDIHEALEVVQSAVSETVKDARKYIYYADLLNRCNQGLSAQTMLEKALVLAQNESGERRVPLEAEIYRMMASGMMNTGSIHAALDSAEKALERSPDDLALRTQTAELSMALLKFDLAREISKIQTVLLPSGSARGAKLALIAAEAGLECGNLDEAIAAWEECVGDPGWKTWQLSIEARLDARGGDWVRAEEMARRAIGRALEGDKGESDQLIWAGKAAIEAGLWDEGLDVLQSYLEQHPSEPGGTFELGKALALIAERERDCRDLACIVHAPGTTALSDEAHARFKSLMEQTVLTTQSAEAVRWLARGEVAFAPSLQTIKVFGRIANTTVDTGAIVRGLRGIGNWPSAAVAAQQAPEIPEVQFQLGLGYLVEDPECGFETISKLQELMPRMPLMKVLESRLAECTGRMERAAQALEEALSIWPDEPVWQCKAASLAEETNNYPKAAQHWKSAAHLMPNSSEFPLALGRNFVHMERYCEAVEAFDRATRLNPADYEGWIDLARAARMAGMLPESMESAQRASQLRPEDVRGLLLTSEIASDLGNAEIAAEYARMALRQEPQNPGAVLALSNALVKVGKEEEGLGIIEEKLAEMTPSLPLLFERARLVYKLKGAAAASGLVAKLAQTHPENTEVLAMMARVQVESGDKKGAERSAIKSLRLDSEQPDISLLLGKIERELGQLDQAVHFLSETVRMEPKNVEAYLELGQTYLDRREHTATLDVYRQAIRAVPNDKRCYYEAAIIFKDCKDYVAAEKMLQQAAKLDPDDLQIRRQLIAVMALNLIHKSQEANTSI
jgi:tetratricopeptide (TPR) repeat protein